MVAIPVLALVSVAVAVRVSSDSSIDSRLSFEIVPVRRVGGGLTNPDDPVDLPVFETKIDLSSSQPVTFVDTGTGEQFTIQADRGFVDAFEKDRRDAISEINRQVTIAAIAVAVLALIVSVWLSRRIVHPVEKLTRAARRLESGDLSQRVRVHSTDEIGALGHAFNAMAQSIERSQNLRRQMTSDVAHELRTPLNNISGYLDAIADGVVAPNADVIESLQEEANLLVSLVKDLEQLSLADAGKLILRLERISLNDLAVRVVAGIAPRARAANVSLRTDLSAVPAIEGDASRLGQVIRNLLENAITHTPEGGEITLTLTSTENDHLGCRTRHWPGDRPRTSAVYFRTLLSGRSLPCSRHRRRRTRTRDCSPTGRGAWRHGYGGERTRRREQLHSRSAGAPGHAGQLWRDFEEPVSAAFLASFSPKPHTKLILNHVVLR